MRKILALLLICFLVTPVYADQGSHIEEQAGGFGNKESINVLNESVRRLLALVRANYDDLSDQITAAAPPTGSIFPYGASAAPTNYLLCDGTAVSRTTYAALFTAIGTTFGTGDGSTTFNVPDLRGRAPIGIGTGSGLTARSLNDAVGTETHALSEAELASHTHGVTIPTNLNGGIGASTIRSGSVGVDDSEVVTSDSTGSGTAHQNMQPSRAVNFIIKVN